MVIGRKRGERQYLVFLLTLMSIQGCRSKYTFEAFIDMIILGGSRMKVTFLLGSLHVLLLKSTF